MLACNVPSSLINFETAAAILEVKGDDIQLLERFSRNTYDKKINLFELGAGLTLLSDSRVFQKSELLIDLFDTNDNHIIGENELHILVRCCIVAFYLLMEQNTDITSHEVYQVIDDLKQNNRYAKNEGISVTDFTHFLLESSKILEFLNCLGLFV